MAAPQPSSGTSGKTLTGLPLIVSPKDGVTSTTRIMRATVGNSALLSRAKKAKDQSEGAAVPGFVSITLPTGALVDTFIPTRDQINSTAEKGDRFQPVFQKLSEGAASIQEMSYTLDRLERSFAGVDTSGNSNQGLKKALTATKDTDKLYAYSKLAEKSAKIRVQIDALREKINQLPDLIDDGNEQGSSLYQETKREKDGAILSPASEVHKTVISKLDSRIFKELETPIKTYEKEIQALTTTVKQHVEATKTLLPDNAKREIDLTMGRVASEQIKPE